MAQIIGTSRNDNLVGTSVRPAEQAVVTAPAVDPVGAAEAEDVVRARRAVGNRKAVHFSPDGTAPGSTTRPDRARLRPDARHRHRRARRMRRELRELTGAAVVVHTETPAVPLEVARHARTLGAERLKWTGVDIGDSLEHLNRPADAPPIDVYDGVELPYANAACRPNPADHARAFRIRHRTEQIFREGDAAQPSHRRRLQQGWPAGRTQRDHDRTEQMKVAGHIHFVARKAGGA